METEARNTKQRGVKRVLCHRWVVWMKNVRKIRWHDAMTETQNTVTKTDAVLYSILALT